MTKGKATGQRFNGSIKWIERYQCALRLRYLAEQRFAVDKANPDDISRFDHLRRCLWSWAKAIGINERSSPLHALPADAVLAAVPKDGLGGVVRHATNDRRLQPRLAAIVTELFQPVRLIRDREVSFRATVAMALVILDQPLNECLVGCDLTLAAWGGLDAEPISVGGATEATDHFGTGHFGDIRCVKLGRVAVIGGIDGLCQCLLIAGFV